MARSNWWVGVRLLLARRGGEALICKLVFKDLGSCRFGPKQGRTTPYLARVDRYIGGLQVAGRVEAKGKKR